MTVAVAYPWKSRVVLGADSRCTAGSAITAPVQKLHPIETADAVVAGAGTVGAIQAAVRQSANNRIQSPDEFAQVLRDLQDSDETEWLWAQPGGELYSVCGSGGSVLHTEPWSIGSGGTFARGVLAGGSPKNLSQVKALVEKALRLTGDAFSDCGAPYHIVVV